jgi:hypothetical protein
MLRGKAKPRQLVSGSNFPPPVLIFLHSNVLKMESLYSSKKNNPNSEAGATLSGLLIHRIVFPG